MKRLTREQRKQLLRNKEEQARLAEAKTSIRKIGEKAVWLGAHRILIQISKIPSFEPGKVWDICGIGADKIALFVSYIDLFFSSWQDRRHDTRISSS